MQASHHRFSSSSDEGDGARSSEKAHEPDQKRQSRGIKTSFQEKPDSKSRDSPEDRRSRSGSHSPVRKKSKEEKGPGSSRELEKPRNEDSKKDRERSDRKKRERSPERFKRDYDSGRRRDERRSDERVGRGGGGYDRRNDEYRRSEGWRGGRRDDRFAKSDSHWKRGNRPGRDFDRRRRDYDQPERQSRESEEESTGDRPAWATKAVIKRAEEIQQRKLLWGKRDEKKEDEKALPEKPTSTWNSVMAATSSDSKQLDKFKRLMGMKKSDEPSESSANVNEAQLEAERERQRTLYKDLDQQYAVARSTTHLGRGQGLGFHQ